MISLTSKLKGMSSSNHQSKRDAKQKRREERKQGTQRLQDEQRQKDPNGLLKLALQKGFRRNSFTAADPGRFYKGHQHAGGDDPWKTEGGER